MNSSQETAATIKHLLAERKVSTRQMLHDCNLNENSIFTMQNSGYFPRVDTLVKIANYLNCSVDSLLGRESLSNNEHDFFLSEQEKKLVSAYRNQPDLQKAVDRLLEIDTPTLKTTASDPTQDNTVKLAAHGGDKIELNIKDIEKTGDALHKSDQKDEEQ